MSTANPTLKFKQPKGPSETKTYNIYLGNSSKLYASLKHAPDGIVLEGPQGFKHALVDLEDKLVRTGWSEPHVWLGIPNNNRYDPIFPQHDLSHLTSVQQR